MTKNDLIYKDFFEKFPNSEVQNKKSFEDSLCEYLHRCYRIKIERASYEGKLYPELLILDRTRNIFGYISIERHIEEEGNSRKQAAVDSITRKKIQVCYSELDRPANHYFEIQA